MSDGNGRTMACTPHEIQAVLDDFAERYLYFSATRDDFDRVRDAGKALTGLFSDTFGRTATPADISWDRQDHYDDLRDYSEGDLVASLCGVKLGAAHKDPDAGGPDIWEATINPMFRNADDPSPSVGLYAWGDWADAEQTKQAIAERIIERIGVTPIPSPAVLQSWEREVALKQLDCRQG